MTSYMKTGVVDDFDVTQIVFDAKDLRSLDQASEKPQFARSLALTLWAVGSAKEQKTARATYKKRIDSALRQVRKSFHALDRLGYPQGAAYRNATAQEERTLSALQKRIAKANRPSDIHTRMVIHAVAYQMRKHGAKVSISVVNGADRGSTFLLICQVLLRIMGKPVTLAAIKHQAIQAKVLRFGKFAEVYSGDIGAQGVLLSEGKFGKHPDGEYHVRCSEYRPALGSRGFQFVAKLSEMAKKVPPI